MTDNSDIANFDHNASLLQLLQADEEMSEDALVDIPQRVLSKPVRKLQPDELLWLLSQGVSLAVVVPLSIEKLQDAPMLEAQTHPGDLLIALMESRIAFWLAHYEYWEAVIEILTEVIAQLQAKAPEEEGDDYMPGYVGDDFMGALMHFRGIFKE